MHFVIYRDSIGQWRWRLKAANNRVVADSAESYWNKADCISGITLVKAAYTAPTYEA